MTQILAFTGPVDAISIHIPRVGDDDVRPRFTRRIAAAQKIISIHIPRVGDDQVNHNITVASTYFNPHPPCGG